MNVSNSSSAPAYQPPTPVTSKPAAGDHDGDADDGGVAKSGGSASESSEGGLLNVRA